jgi:DNA invertase Pin-like site-specific DNA recombinase
MRIGYARVSREDQNPQYQHDALSAAGCARIFEDRISGAEFSRGLCCKNRFLTKTAF